jgi:6,7-dimethyl-8-ribityllumazine synthase
MSPASNILIVEARFYDDIADELVRGALGVLDGAGAGYDRISVPGAFEIPAAVRIAELGRDAAYDGYVALGCVIRGETSHYDYVCGESARGLQSLAIDHGLAIGYGILTVEDREQAWARAAVDKGNKGGSATQACLEMIALRRRFGLG